ncbi:hypothetical protein SLS62_005052 [Diatrype stigma]|uniref:Uncharacterized protein n=1 Tax=Diatrype stigma TaxID=117547 RepID=A0AAN9US56_9PEZI
MTLPRKISVTVEFILGYCSAFMSLARFIIIMRNPSILRLEIETDPYCKRLKHGIEQYSSQVSNLLHAHIDNTIPLRLTSMLEAPFAIVALCAPSIGKLLNPTIERGSTTSAFSKSNGSSSEREGSVGTRDSEVSRSRHDEASNNKWEDHNDIV